MLQFGSLPEPIKQAWQAACIRAVQQWAETTFKTALLDDERVETHALHMLKVGHDKGDPPVETMRIAIGSFVVGLADPGAIASL